MIGAGTACRLHIQPRGGRVHKGHGHRAFVVLATTSLSAPFVMLLLGVLSSKIEGTYSKIASATGRIAAAFLLFRRTGSYWERGATRGSLFDAVA